VIIEGFGLETGFINHLYTWLVITISYSAIANLYILRTTRVHAKYVPACSVFTNRFPVTASNDVDSSASALTPFSAGHRLTTELSSKLFPAYNTSAQTNKKHSSFIVACM
jgi:hypothetical protein